MGGGQRMFMFRSVCLFIVEIDTWKCVFVCVFVHLGR